MTVRHRWLLAGAAILCLLYLVLLIPSPSPSIPPTPENHPFIWNRDAYWSQLESRFKEARMAGCINLSLSISAGFSRVDSLLKRLQTDTLQPEAPIFNEMESAVFSLGTNLGACPERLPDYIRTFGAIRTAVKDQSSRWNINSATARDCIYKLLYGGRTAVEEIVLQATPGAVTEAILESREPSATPSAQILGVMVHSGDILVSRGGAPTSALIARGNDYPGNFSHIALVYVDSTTGDVSIIESHIEKGVAIATVDDYLRDTKLRIMVLRLRSDLSAMTADPMMPHKAAAYALARANGKHIAYDFAMDTGEPSQLFCSEVVSDGYRHVGVNLWDGLSHISSPGVKLWLAAFGVRNFTTEEPSDLEYDPQLRVVAEWRDFETLRKDRLDNAVVDVMLEGAERGDRLDYDWYILPVARIMKAYSMILNRFGKIGPVPEGMSAAGAARNKWFSHRHAVIKERLGALAERFQQDNGYWPPYWELIKLAHQVASE
ncbi:MAG: YiiX/YebB-like N1pC/P60 family cysteine hydrolase [candidate division Zixibacteria bacterium]|nr:YiiX/YebB-like N1pC/P60 family cysteine hydrolase [candidate division Zixibacteria bacterium]